MKSLYLTVCLLVASIASAQDSSAVIERWEQVQRESDLVASFDKIDEGRYQISFGKMPFEGELVVHSVDIEPYPESDYLPFSQSAYVTAELIDLPDNFIAQFENLYFRWQQSNQLYFEPKAQAWFSADEYQEVIAQIDYDEIHAPSLAWQVLAYWEFVFVAIVLYFFVSTLSGNRRVKRSLQIQQESVELQKQSVEQAIALHRETNELLKQLLAK